MISFLPVKNCNRLAWWMSKWEWRLCSRSIIFSLWSTRGPSYCTPGIWKSQLRNPSLLKYPRHYFVLPRGYFLGICKLKNIDNFRSSLRIRKLIWWVNLCSSSSFMTALHPFKLLFHTELICSPWSRENRILSLLHITPKPKGEEDDSHSHVVSKN